MTRIYYGSSDTPKNPWYFTRDQKKSLLVGLIGVVIVIVGVLLRI